MTFAEARVALQLEAEERIGRLIREQDQEQRALEDAALATARAARGVP